MFDARLKEIRSASGERQKDTAQALGVSPERYNQYENGRRAPDFEIVCRLARHFNVSTDYLLGNTNAQAPPSAKKDAPGGTPDLDPDISEIINLIQSLSDDGRRQLLEHARAVKSHEASQE